MLELELTRNCQLECTHCYAESSPMAAHGVMTTADWERVMIQAADMGVGMVQLIGGEPTRHPQFARVLAHAMHTVGRVEIYTNLLSIPDPVWDQFACPGVSLATSYYSDEPGEHEQITGRVGSHARTRANIARAVDRDIPIRAGVVQVLPNQRVEQARADLEALGVSRIGPVDQMREVGRATSGPPGVEALCGRCGDQRAAISSTGDVTPCVMARWPAMAAGNVLETSLPAILDSPSWSTITAMIPRQGVGPCNPDNDGDDCRPAEHPACPPWNG